MGSNPTAGTTNIKDYIMEIKPLGKNILIAENRKSETTASGIIVEGGGHESKIATVLAIGEEVTAVSVGDVIFPDWSEGSRIKFEGSDRVIIKEEQVLAVVK